MPLGEINATKKISPFATIGDARALHQHAPDAALARPLLESPRRLVLYLLSQAAEMGLTTAVLSCERQIAPLYRSLGFSISCELTTYWMESLWR